MLQKVKTPNHQVKRRTELILVVLRATIYRFQQLNEKKSCFGGKKKKKKRYSRCFVDFFYHCCTVIQVLIEKYYDSNLSRLM